MESADVGRKVKRIFAIQQERQQHYRTIKSYKFISSYNEHDLGGKNTLYRLVLARIHKFY